MQSYAEVQNYAINRKTTKTMRNLLLKASVAAAFTLLASAEGNTCTNVIVSRGASMDGSVLVSYAADSHYLFGELYYHPAQDWKLGEAVRMERHGSTCWRC